MKPNLPSDLRFPDAQHVIVRLAPGDDGSGQLAFTNPITDKDLRDIAYFMEFLNPNSASTTRILTALLVVRLARRKTVRTC